MEEKGKNAVFLCKCGSNISNFVDMNNLQNWSKENDSIDCVYEHNLLCSPDGKKYFKEMLDQDNPQNIIIAACSPKMHEKTFQNAAQEVGFNISRVGMANIREQVAWVTENKNDATEKSKVIINAAIKRAGFNEDLEKHSIECLTDLCIIGGGIAGIEAALTASKAGRKVYIIEKEISLGGKIIQTEEIAPSMECAPCLLAPRLTEIKDDPNIYIFSNTIVTDILGFMGNFTIKAKKKPRYIKENCIGCEACFDVCPINVKSDFHLGLGTRKAIYTQFPGSVPAAAVIDKEKCLHFIDGSCSACVDACPFLSVDFEEKKEKIEINVGAVILATGYKNADISNIKELAYKEIKDVYTLSEFERLASSNGPSAGKIILANGGTPKSIVVIHCAGSLRNDCVSYCSGLCCVLASKVGELVRKDNNNIKIINIHDNLVFTGPKENDFYKKQIKDGTNYIKCKDLTSITISQELSGIKIEGLDLDSIIVDMVVLATGMIPNEDTKEVANIANVELSNSGFYAADNEIINVTGASLDGVYIAGAAGGPCNISNAVTKGKAAAGDFLSKLIPGKKIDLEIMTSIINTEICAGCKLCISVCPYKAIVYNKEKKISTVIESICRGCGTCAASCPSGAIKAKHFTDKQISAEIEGLLNE